MSFIEYNLTVILYIVIRQKQWQLITFLAHLIGFLVAGDGATMQSAQHFQHCCSASMAKYFKHAACSVFCSSVYLLYHAFYKTTFYPAMLERVRLCHSKSSVRPSVCPSVRPSVTFGYVFHTGWSTSKIISRMISVRFLLGLTPTWATWSNGNTLKIWVEWG